MIALEGHVAQPRITSPECEGRSKDSPFSSALQGVCRTRACQSSESLLLVTDHALARQVVRVIEEEWSYIPVGGPLPVAGQPVTAFGAAANLIHPATGYSIARRRARQTCYLYTPNTACHDCEYVQVLVRCQYARCESLGRGRRSFICYRPCLAFGVELIAERRCSPLCSRPSLTCRAQLARGARPGGSHPRRAGQAAARRRDRRGRLGRAVAGGEAAPGACCHPLSVVQ